MATRGRFRDGEPECVKWGGTRNSNIREFYKFPACEHVVRLCLRAELPRRESVCQDGRRDDVRRVTSNGLFETFAGKKDLEGWRHEGAASSGARAALKGIVGQHDGGFEFALPWNCKRDARSTSAGLASFSAAGRRG
jgi:hypothetical protein